MLRYRLKLEPDDNGTVLVTSPDLPIVTYGETEDDAMMQAADAAQAVLESMMEAREDLPVPKIPKGDKSPLLRLPLQTLLKLQLYIAMRTEGLTRADLQRRLGWQRESIDRLFRLNHNSRIDQIEQAFHALGKAVDIKLSETAA